MYYRAIINDVLWFLPHAVHSIIYLKNYHDKFDAILFWKIRK